MFVAPSGLGVVLSEDGKNVWVRIGKPDPSLGFDPELVLAMSLEPGEARRLAQLLTGTALMAEGGPISH